MKKKGRNDLILAGALLFLAVAGFLIFHFSRSSGKWAVVLIDGQETARYSLSEEMKTVIHTPAGTNTLVIQKGEASVQEANCPDKICAAHRPVSGAGETIVCLPHKLVVRIEADSGSHVNGMA